MPLLGGLPFLRSPLTRMFFFALCVFCGCLLFVSMVFALFVFLLLVVCLLLFCVSSMSFPGDDVIYLLATGSFLSVSFCLLPLLFLLERVPGLIWFGSVYLVAPVGFVADQFMCDK